MTIDEHDDALRALAEEADREQHGFGVGMAWALAALLAIIAAASAVACVLR